MKEKIKNIAPPIALVSPKQKLILNILYSIEQLSSLFDKKNSKKLLMQIAPALLFGKERNFIKLVNKSKLLKKGSRLRRKLKKLNIEIKFDNKYVILRYPLALKQVQVMEAVSYASTFRDIIETIDGLREKNYRKRAKDDEVEKRYKKIIKECRKFRTKKNKPKKMKDFYIAAGGRYFRSPETIKTIISRKLRG